MGCPQIYKYINLWRLPAVSATRRLRALSVGVPPNLQHIEPFDFRVGQRRGLFGSLSVGCPQIPSTSTLHSCGICPATWGLRALSSRLQAARLQVPGCRLKAAGPQAAGSRLPGPQAAGSQAACSRLPAPRLQAQCCQAPGSRMPGCRRDSFQEARG